MYNLTLFKRYIQWTEQAYPQGGKESSLNLLLERTVMKFTEDTKYHNDSRYVDLWVKYVSLVYFYPVECSPAVFLCVFWFKPQTECCSDPLDVYRYMRAQGIGTMQSSFYIAWAEEYEKRGNSRMADSIFQDGLRCGAEPLDRLQQFHKYENSCVLIYCFSIYIPHNNMHFW